MASELVHLFSHEESLRRMLFGSGGFRAHAREALWRFRWRMRNPRSMWPGIVTAWWGDQALRWRRLAFVTEMATASILRLGEALRDLPLEAPDAD